MVKREEKMPRDKRAKICASLEVEQEVHDQSSFTAHCSHFILVASTLLAFTRLQQRVEPHRQEEVHLQNSLMLWQTNLNL
jgi:hypothetical protein